MRVNEDGSVHVTGLSAGQLVRALHDAGWQVVVQGVSRPDTGCLSERELDIVRLIGSGANNKHIADCLFLSANTVKTYIRSAYRKMNVTSRTEAVLWAVQRGLTAAPRRASHR